ncbi:MAG: ABC transporter permease subunit, partial [Nitrososphaeria archaeon]|nr:ABC transporter permease subunit [Nitrososphaeria archaeon]
KERAYVDSARAIGAGNVHIILKHILPNTIPIILASTILRVVNAILSEAGLSFLGLGDP